MIRLSLSGRATGSALAAFLAMTPIGATRAAEVKVIAAGAVRGVLGGMVDDYARQTGHKFTFTIGSTGRLREIIASGEAADLVIAASGLMDDLEKTGRMTPGSRVDLGRIGVGTVVREGFTSANVATVEGLRQALVDAKTIAYTDPKLGGATYAHLMMIAERFGLADMVRAKGVFATGGDDAAAKVAAGQADFAMAFISEIQASGAKLAAPLPDSIQLWAAYSAAIPANSKEAGLARDFATALTSPALRERWSAAGWQAAK